MRKIDAGELAERSDGGSVVVVGRVLSGKLCRPCIEAASIDSDACYPLPVTHLDDALVGVAAIASPLPIPKVFAAIADAKVASPVVEPITIDVIDEDSIVGLKDDAMHQPSALFGSGCVPVAGTPEKKSPLEARKRVDISGINDGKQAIRYLDVRNRFVSSQNVITLVWMCGRLYAVSRCGDRVAVRFVPKRKRERPTLPGVVVPFPGGR